MQDNRLNTFLNLAIAVLLPVLILAGLRIGFLRDRQETSDDAYWHIAAARRPVSEMISKKFPMQLSVWNEHFADKELAFHLLLKTCTSFKAFFGKPLSPPFNGAFLLLIFLFFLAFALSSWKMGIEPPEIILAALGCALIAPTFTYRLMMIRPHVLSMAMMMIVYGILAGNPARRKTFFLMILMGFLYAWSYSTPHLLLIPAFLFALAWWKKERFRAFAGFAGALSGLVLGLVIHPQFPNTFLIWKVQALDALLAPLSGGKIQLPFAQELVAPSAAWHAHTFSGFLLMYLILMVLVRAWEKQCFGKIPEKTLAMILCAGAWTVLMTFISMRTIEYMIPAICTAGMLVLQFAGKEKLFPCLQKKFPLYVFLAVLILAGGLLFCWTGVYTFIRGHLPSPPVMLAERLRYLERDGYLAKGGKVANLDWSDFPLIHFTAPEYVYTCGLDPMFGYAEDPVKATIVGDACSCRRPVSMREVREATGADIAVLIGERRDSVGIYLTRNCGWNAIYRASDGWIFLLR